MHISRCNSIGRPCTQLIVKRLFKLIVIVRFLDAFLICINS